MNSVSETRQHNTRLGLILFAIYFAIYLGFVLLSAFSAGSMETQVLAGLNLAIVYGFALIIGALVMALIYGMMCKSEPIEELDSPQSAADSSEPKKTEGV